MHVTLFGGLIRGVALQMGDEGHSVRTSEGKYQRSKTDPRPISKTHAAEVLLVHAHSNGCDIGDMRQTLQSISESLKVHARLARFNIAPRGGGGGEAHGVSKVMWEWVKVKGWPLAATFCFKRMSPENRHIVGCGLDSVALLDARTNSVGHVLGRQADTGSP